MTHTKCTNARRFKGLRYPRCLGGQGCDACLFIWIARRAAVVAAEILAPKKKLAPAGPLG